MTVTTSDLGDASTTGAARALSWFSRFAWLGILSNFALGGVAMFYPEIVLQLLSLEPAAPLVWPRFGGFMLVLLSIFYIAGAVDPAGLRFAAIYAVLCRFAGAAFFILIGGGYALFSLYDLALALPQAVLLWLARPALRDGG
jgi:hypothetical protein